MRSVQLVVTGDVEVAALAESLRRWFPSVLGGDDVTWRKPRRTSGGTSNRVRVGQPRNPFARLATAAVAEVLDVRQRGVPVPDLVVAIDDLEVFNHDQPDVVVASFRAAVDAVLTGRGAEHPEDPRRAAVRERLSFHLACLMPESWFFGERGALVRAGCAPDVEPIWSGGDVERFVLTDPASAARCADRDATVGRIWPGWREALHARHYLDDLVARAGKIYVETEHGAAALASLDWRAVAPVGCARFVQALFEDVAWFFGVPSPLPSPAACPTCPSTTARRDQLVLRNA